MRALIVGVLVTASAAAAAAPQGRGRGGGAIAVMTLSTTAWADGGQIPLKHSQAGDELSPPLTWNDPPATTASFVLIVHDMDATNANGDLLQWLVWNVPASSAAGTHARARLVFVHSGRTAEGERDE